MRASVLLISTLAATTACRDNPGFTLSIGADGGQGDTGRTTGISSDETGATDEAGTSADGTTPVVCTPVAEKLGPDACTQEPLLPYPPDLYASQLFNTDDCRAPRQIHVKRSGDILHTCNDDMCADCPMDRTVGIGKASLYNEYDDLLPADGKCARLWHTSGNIPPTGKPCSSTAYAAFDIDAEGGRLRFAVSYGLDDPFDDVDGFDFSARPSQPTACPDDAALQSMCDAPAVARPIALDFRFDTCELPDVVQGSTWVDLVVDDTPYRLDVYASYQCFPGDLFYSWFLRRD